MWKYENLDFEEHSVYLIDVKCSENNLEHESYLFTGFKTGSYCYVYNNSYDAPIKMQDCYSIKIKQKLK